MIDDFLVDELSLRAMVEEFEQGRPDHLNHAQHLAVCVWYILNDNFPLTRLRHAIRNHVEVNGGINGPDSGFHESLTRWWLQTVDGFMRTLSARSALEYARAAVAEYGDKKHLWKTAYGEFDLVHSREARERWISPEEAGLIPA